MLFSPSSKEKSKRIKGKEKQIEIEVIRFFSQWDDLDDGFKNSHTTIHHVSILIFALKNCTHKHKNPFTL